MPPRSIGAGYHDKVISAFHEAGVFLHIGQEAATLAAIPSLVAAGFGISILPRSLGRIDIDHVVYRPIVGSSLRAPIALSCRRVNCPPTAQKLLAVARKCVQIDRRMNGAQRIRAQVAGEAYG